jgi:type 1 fimbria pilin
MYFIVQTPVFISLLLLITLLGDFFIKEKAMAKLNKISLFMGSLALVASIHAFADGGGANIHFKGSVTNDGCTVQVNNGSNDATVDMGTINMHGLAVGDATDPVTFQIQLTECPASMSNAEVTFLGNTSPDDKYFALTGTNNQSLGLEIKNTQGGDGSTITPNVQDITGMPSAGNNAFTGSYSAQLVKLTDDVIDGSFDVSTAVNIVYL